jgi:hypothetical protein
MSDDDKTVTVPGLSHDNAVLLLEAAQALELDPSVVRTNGLGEFEVPAEVAKKAGFDEEGKPTGKAAKEAAEADADAESDLDTAGLPEHDDDADPQGTEPQQPAKKTAASRKGTQKSGE